MLSVILTSYNRPVLLKRAVDSLFSQTSDDWQLIIADDNSSKPEVHRIIAKAAKDPRVVAWRSNVRDEDRLKHVRPSVLINESYRFVRGDIIGYLTDDCWLLPDCVEVVNRFFAVHPEIDCAYCIEEIRYCNMETGEEHGGKAYRGWYNKPLDKAFCVVDHNQVFHRRKAVDMGLRWTTDPFNWKAPDGVTFDTLIKLCGPLYPINEVLVVYYYHEHNISRKDLTCKEALRW